MQRLVIQVEPGAWVKASDLSDRLRRGQGLRARLAPKPGTLKEIVEQVERALILEALSEHDGNKTRAAAKLGMTREGLHKKIVRFGL
jgi:transcriptional regulator with PAS, ATPase and Fis domain